LPALRFLHFSFFVARVECNETRERHESFAIVPGFRSAQSGLRLTFVIAGLDPAIHAAKRLKQKFGLAEIASSQHGPPDQVRR
ncbi:MAG: hypothetical protein WB868_06035, partial [Xanthobacteraceae bacterium]